MMVFLYLFGLTSKVQAAFVQPHELDWNNTIHEDGFYFVPLPQLNQGILLYERYDRALIGPSFAYSPYEKTIRIRVIPTLYNTNKYKSFLKDNNLVDIRRNLDSKKMGICKPTQALLRFFKTMTFMPKFSMQPGNYPGLCSLEIKYLVPDGTDDETRLLTYISSHPIIRLDWRIPGQVVQNSQSSL